ncbi:MAG: shikimate dehydrogenase family protein [Aquirufa sp.]
MAITSLFGLIGYPLGHSFSKKYFTEKFQVLGLSESHAYEQFELSSIDLFPGLLQQHAGILKGLNVTIPYKQAVIPFLDEIDLAALKIGAVNTIKIFPNGKTKGFNSDFWGFRSTIEKWEAFPKFKNKKALVLGQGGAAKAIVAALEDLNIEVLKVSRNAAPDTVTYDDLASIIDDFALVVNTTPLGMHPNIHTLPELPYELLNQQHYFYDIVYNPLQTAFLKKGLDQGIGGVHEGLEMLHGQADKAWEIWN